MPVLREVMGTDGKKTFVTERAFDAFVREEFENQMFAQMFPNQAPRETQTLRDPVDVLMEPVEYYEHMAGRPDVELPEDVVHKDPKSLDVPRISQRIMMGGSFIETGSILDQTPADAGMDDIMTEAVSQAVRSAKVAPRASRAAQKANAELVPDEQGVTLLEEFEGNEPFAYNDGAGYLTIGIGHKLTDDELRSGYVNIGGESVYWKSGLTGDQIDMLAQQDLGTATDIVKRHVKVPLSQNQFNALTSFAYNVGPKPFVENAGFLQALNRGDEADFLKRFQMYVRAKGVVLPGLQRRRAAEAALFMAGRK
jgi:lysozyme